MDIIGFVPQFGSLIWTLLAFVMALSVIVAVHEYGHYIVGRWSGIHAEVFSVGFGPVLFSRIDRRGTRWQIAALPFGGYVKFLGDADAASGRDDAAMAGLAQNAPERLRGTMHGAPLWARAATVAAGPVFNFVMSVMIFTVLVLLRGQASEPLTIGELRAFPQDVYELREGDRIISIAGVPAPAFDDSNGWERVSDALPGAGAVRYEVERNGERLALRGPHLYPPLVVNVSPQSAALAAGIAPGDVITAIDGDPVHAFDQLKAAVEGSDGAPLALTLWRDGTSQQVTLAPKRVDEPQPGGGFVTHWRIGIAGGMAFEPATQTPGIGTALGIGFSQLGQILQSSLSGLWHMITGAISTCNLSGPIGIAETSGAMASQGAESFIWFIAVLSAAVGMLNLFPIPALDGGHLVFYAYEALAGRPPSEAVVRVLMSVGIAAILTLMGFALFNDIFCP